MVKHAIVWCYFYLIENLVDTNIIGRIESNKDTQDHSYWTNLT